MYFLDSGSIWPYLDPRIFTTHLFGKRTVFSAHANFNKWVLQNEGRLFTAKYPKGLSVIIGKYGMLSIIDDLHRKSYGIAVRLLSMDKLKAHFLEELDSMDKLKAHFLEELDSMIRSRVNQWIGNDILLQDECRKIPLIKSSSEHSRFCLFGKQGDNSSTIKTLFSSPALSKRSGSKLNGESSSSLPSSELISTITGDESIPLQRPQSR
ncbi:Abietadienol/abietadienal oxidase [Nymphaea thermarum]|nr:Abietadienol/abietadienal oxidase [Nymphaea thermarum]